MFSAGHASSHSHVKPFGVYVKRNGPNAQAHKILFTPNEIVNFERTAWVLCYGHGVPVPMKCVWAYDDGEPVSIHEAEDVNILRVLAENEMRCNRSLVVLRVRSEEEEWCVDDKSAGLTDVRAAQVYAEADVVEEEEVSPPSDMFPCFPSSHPFIRSVEVFSMVVVLFSVFSFVVETLPQYRLDSNGQERQHATFFMFETVCIAWFTFEYSLRLFNARREWKKFVIAPLNVIDLVAILPFYIGLMVGSSSASSLAIIRILRLTRITRIFKFSRHFKGLQDMVACIASTWRELILFATITSVAVVLFASMMFYCEKDEPDTKFRSIPVSFWWAIVTIATVGYGDFVPVTVQGKFVGALCATLGVVTLAIPAGIFISEYMRVHQEKASENKRRADDFGTKFENSISELIDLWQRYQIAHAHNIDKLKNLSATGANAPTTEKVV